MDCFGENGASFADLAEIENLVKSTEDRIVPKSIKGVDVAESRRQKVFENNSGPACEMTRRNPPVVARHLQNAEVRGVPIPPPQPKNTHDFSKLATSILRWLFAF